MGRMGTLMHRMIQKGGVAEISSCGDVSTRAQRKEVGTLV